MLRGIVRVHGDQSVPQRDLHELRRHGADVLRWRIVRVGGLLRGRQHVRGVRSDRAAVLPHGHVRDGGYVRRREHV